MKAAFRALLPWLAMALARALEASLGLVLHTSLQGADVVAAAVRALDLETLAARTLGYAAVNNVL